MLKQAYKKLKSSTYYDKTMVILRKQIAIFEKNMNENTFRNLAHSIISTPTGNHNGADSVKEDSWEHLQEDLLKSIGYAAYPKSIIKPNQKTNDNSKPKSGYIITNYSENALEIGDYNLFINAKVSLHIIGALWVMEIGSILDKELYDKSFGNRLRPEIFDEVRKGGNYSPHLFRYYFKEYEKWWSGAVKVAENLTDSNEGTMIMSLDLTSFYYNVSFEEKDFDSFYDKYSNLRGENPEIKRINNFIFQVLKNYGTKISGVMDKCKDTPCLPIGFLPSNILANYSLKEFDFAIIDKISPVYYGRYVDDILIVVSMDKQSKISKGLIKYEIDKDSVNCAKMTAIEVLLQYFSKSEKENCKNYIHLKELQPSESKEKKWAFVLNGQKTNFEINESKIRLFYFTEGHNNALLKIFKKHVANNVSEFNLLPYDESIDIDKINHIYDLDRVDSSIFRGVRGFEVNRYELSKLLGRQLMISHIVDDKSVFLDESLEIFDEYVLMSNMTLWEGLFTYYVINDKDENIIHITCKIINALYKIVSDADFNIKDKRLKRAFIKTVRDQYTSALARALSLRVSDDNLNEMYDTVEKYVVHHDIKNHLFYDGLLNDLQDFQEAMYNAVMFDKRFVPLFFVPGAPFSKNKKRKLKLYKVEDLTKLFNDKIENKKQENDLPHYEFLPYMLSPFDIKLKESYIDMLRGNAPSADEEKHNNCLDEFCGYNHNKKRLTQENETERRSVLAEYIKCHDHKEIRKNRDVSVIEIKSESSDKPRIAVANTPLPTNSTELGRSLRTARRYNHLANVVNEAIKNDADILILPESYVPYEWLYTLSRKSIDNDMAIITGIDYVNVNTASGKKTYNLTAVILPFRGEHFSYSNLEFHTKVHYSPEERSIIQNYRREPVSGNSYTLFRWKGCWFTTYCCYEIASIEDRGIFTSSVDIVFITENNKDTNYFNNVINSLARDLHCYCVQANYSDYGDSGITSPQKTEKKDLIRIKGGKNSTALVDCINVGLLRKSQLKSYDKDGMFKPVPPGFDHDKLRKRMRGECPLPPDDKDQTFWLYLEFYY